MNDSTSFSLYTMLTYFILYLPHIPTMNPSPLHHDSAQAYDLLQFDTLFVTPATIALVRSENPIMTKIQCSGCQSS